MANFPASLDTLTDPTAANFLNSPSHSQQHIVTNAILQALEAKLGIGATTPAAGKVLHGSGAGASAWAQVDPTVDIATMSSATLAALLTDETGTGANVFANTPSLITPAITSGGTWTGAPVITGAELVGGVIEANVFMDESSLPKSVVLPDSREFRVMDKLQLGSAFSLKIPATSSLQIETAPFTNSFSTANHDHTTAARGGLLNNGSIDWSTFTNNMKTASNTGAPALSNSSQDLASSGLSVSFTLATAGVAFVVMNLGISSTSDFEFRPEIRLGGVVQFTHAPNAAAGNASNRASDRGMPYVMALPVGVNVISAGVNLSSATGPSLAIGGGSISVVVFGQVTA